MESKKIRLLSEDVIGQIAAGEVVERPSAAIKELVENALDAGSTAVTVEIKEGGLTSFRITDNGCGIEPADIRMAFERHATSKIRTANDLYAVETLGFRGEALASIAAVAHVKCTTRARGFEIGMALQNDGGTITDLKEAACPEGTTFLVKDIFYNAPVRRKFMKKPSAETSLVSDLMARLILSHAEISFRYIADGKTIYFSAGDGKLESAVLSIYGMDVLKQLIPVEGNSNGVLVKGFVGVGDVARGNRNHESFFLNGRAMKSPLLSAAVENACRQRVTIGRFPMCILHLTMPFDAADVNVHPNKWEVRFQNENGVREAVETLILEALTSTQRASLTAPSLFAPPVSQRAMPTAQVTAAATVITKSAPEIVQNAPVRASISAPASQPPLPRTSLPPVLRPTGFKESAAPLDPALRQALEAPAIPHDAIRYVDIPSTVTPPAPQAPQEKPAEQIEEQTVGQRFDNQPPRIIGVVFDTYILMEYQDQLLLCDQHAAHERLLYERLIRETAGASVSQALLIPQIIRLSHTEYAVFEENEDTLIKAGFDVAPFGEDAVQLRGVPTVLGQPEIERCFLDALDELASSGTMSVLERTQRVMQMACKHAVKGGERLPMSAIADLIKQIVDHDVPPTCPHGRPLMVSLTHTELDKRFRRIQNG